MRIIRWQFDVDRGGMFTVVKVREGLVAKNYKDPGWYKHPEGAVAYEWKGAPQKAAAAPAMQDASPSAGEVNVVKLTGKMNH